MTRNDKTKIQASRLLKEGAGHREIAEKLKVSLRTIQRWAKETEPVPVKVLVEDFGDEEPLQNALSSHQFDLSLSQRVAIRLLRLSDSALRAVEDTLSDPDTSTANKLRAAKIAGDWLGLGGQPISSAEVFLVSRERIALDAGVNGVFHLK